MAKSKQKTVDVERFQPIRNRVIDAYQYSGQGIRDKKTIRMCAVVFAEQGWMIEEIERVAGGPVEPKDEPRYAKVRASVMRLLDDHGEAVRAGEFVKVTAAVFGLSRFLVRCLEQIIGVTDEDAAEALEAVKMPDAKSERIEISLDDDILDSAEETEQAIARVGGLRNEEIQGADDESLTSE